MLQKFHQNLTMSTIRSVLNRIKPERLSSKHGSTQQKAPVLIHAYCGCHCGTIHHSHLLIGSCLYHPSTAKPTLPHHLARRLWPLSEQTIKRWIDLLLLYSGSIRLWSNTLHIEQRNVRFNSAEHDAALNHLSWEVMYSKWKESIFISRQLFEEDHLYRRK